MGTRTRIKIVHDERVITSTYYNMDGHIKNWSSKLVVALQQTTPKNIIENSSLFQFMNNDNYAVGDDMLSYLCLVELLEDNYNIKVYAFDKTLEFDGGLDAFSRKYY